MPQGTDEERRAYQREWYAKHKAEKDARNAQWKRDNKDRVNEQARLYREANREKCRENLRRYRAKHKVRLAAEAKAKREANIDEARAKARFYANKPARRRTIMAWSIKDKYGITLERFEEMLISHSGRCGCCGNPFKGRKEPCIDHHHASRRARGLLCDNCNRGIGNFHDSPEVCRLAAAYLELHLKP